MHTTSSHIRCQAILFDMDGILISSIDSVERSWTKWALMRGLDPASAIRMAHGRRALETVARLRPDLDAEAEFRLIEEIELNDGDGVTVLPGVLDLLASLPPHRWTVVTSATERLARLRLALAGLPVPEKLVSADSVAEGKPHPAPYLAGAALLGFQPTECVVFEDSASGVTAGIAAGCTVIATPFSHTVEELAAANYIIPDLSGVAVRVMEGEQGMELRF